MAVRSDFTIESDLAAADPISITTKNKKPNETNSKQTKSPIGSSNVIDILDMDKQFK
jgi:hypothetical protein